MVKYPSGQGPRSGPMRPLAKQATTSYGRRGMSLEDRINRSNQYYLKNNIAVIHKKPTPIQVVKVDYPKRSAARITEAYYRHASTSDYNGVYQGQYIDFEAKETKNKSSFPLANLPQHQLTHMGACYEQGGLVFLLIAFKAYDQIYLLPYEELQVYLDQTDQRSIGYDYIVDKAFLCPQGLLPMIDYLAALDQYLNQKG